MMMMSLVFGDVMMVNKSGSHKCLTLTDLMK